MADIGAGNEPILSGRPCTCRPLLHRTVTPDTTNSSPTETLPATEKQPRPQDASTIGRSLELARTVSKKDTILSQIRTRPPVFDFSHPYAHERTDLDQLVDFDGPDDPYHPLNWVMQKKITTTVLYAFITMSATWASSAYSPGTHQVAEDFHVSTQVATLGTTLFLFGFGIGPLLWAPLSEVYGRKQAVLPPMFVAACFSFACGASKDIQSVLINRFWVAFFASAPVTNTGGVISDLFSSSQRGYAIASYAMAVVTGTIFSPIVSAALVVQPGLRWRWAEYLTGIIQLVMFFAAMIVLDESYPPRLLVQKARRLRLQSGNWALHSKFEEWDISIKEMARKFLVRPFQLLATPICALVALYASFCYGILYMQLGMSAPCKGLSQLMYELGAIPIIFGEGRGWSLVLSLVPFTAIFIGVTIGSALNILNQLRYNKLTAKTGKRVIPEARLPPMAFGSVMFSGGMFITGWTADPRYAICVI